MAEYPSSPLGELTELITKGTTPTTDGGGFASSGINFIKVESVSPDGSLIPSKFAYVDEPTHKALLRSQLKEDDLLFSIAGTIGRTAIVTAEDLPANTNQALAIIRCRPDQILPRFLLYALRDGKRIQSAQSRVVQSVQANFSLRELGELEVPLPTLPEQRAIAEVLGALDDKIESNRRLECVASELLGCEFRRTSELAGTRRGKIGEIVANLRLKIGGEAGDATVLSAVATSELVASDDFFHKQVYSKDIGKYLKVPQWAVAYNPSRINIGSIGLNCEARLGAVSPVYVVALAQSEASARWLELALKTEAVRDQIVAFSSGSVRQVLRYEDFASIELPIPDPADLERFISGAAPLYELISRTASETGSLASLRDALLPALLSGRIRVSAAAELVEAS